MQVGKEVEDASNADVNGKLWTSNHYDNPRAKGTDLYDDNSKGGVDYMDGANEPGIFLGLEVIDGSQYEVEKIPIGIGSKGTEKKGFISRLKINDASSEFVKDEVARSKLKSDSPTQISKDKNSDVDENTKDGLKNDDPSSESTAAMKPEDWAKLSRKEKNKLKLEKLKAKRKEIKLNKKRRREASEPSTDLGDSATKVDQDQAPSGNKQKKKSKNNKSATATDTLEKVTEQQMTSVQVPWSIATGGVYLHPKICKALYRLKFFSPTPIQSNTLAASILGHRDVVGAAPTGSGKTLSYLLPILHHLLTEEDERNSQGEANAEYPSEVELQKQSFSYPLTALILCPTRELALQVSMEFTKLVQNIDFDDQLSQSGDSSSSKSFIQCGTIVGGLSEQKQKRVLEIKRPPVLVGTPGRLWDLVSPL